MSEYLSFDASVGLIDGIDWGLALSRYFIPLLTFGQWTLSATIVFLLLKCLGGRPRFSTTFSLVAHASVVTLLEAFSSWLILWWRGVSDISSRADLQPAFGLDLWLKTDSEMVAVVLSSLGLFQLWHLALIALGARLLYDLSRQRAALMLLAYYLVTLTASAAFSIAGRWAVESA